MQWGAVCAGEGAPSLSPCGSLCGWWGPTQEIAVPQVTGCSRLRSVSALAGTSRWLWGRQSPRTKLAALGRCTLPSSTARSGLAATRHGGLSGMVPSPELRLVETCGPGHAAHPEPVPSCRPTPGPVLPQHHTARSVAHWRGGRTPSEGTAWERKIPEQRGRALRGMWALRLHSAETKPCLGHPSTASGTESCREGPGTAWGEVLRQQ